MPDYDKDPKRDHNFDNHPYIKAFGPKRPYYIRLLGYFDAQAFKGSTRVL